MEKTHIRRLSNPNYIGSYELMTGGEPKDLVVTIDKIVKEPVQNGDKKEDATVMYIKGQKPMIINATNRKALIKATGSVYIEDMAGKKVTLFVAKVRAFGETVDALRIRPEAPLVTVQELTPEHPKWSAAKTALKSGNTTIEAIKKSYKLSSKNEKELINE